jgi:mannose-6-phosphate isomerase-like protein (cupin superfamily)
MWHCQVEELWYILDGRGQVWRCPPDRSSGAVSPVDVAPGDALTIPTGWRFQFRAAPDAALRFLCYTAPPWPGPDEAVPAESGAWPPTV